MLRKKRRTHLERDGEWVFAISLSPDGKTLASAGGKWDKAKGEYVGGALNLWDLATGRLRSTYTIERWPIWTLAFSPDGKTLHELETQLGQGSQKTLRKARSSFGI